MLQTCPKILSQTVAAPLCSQRKELPTSLEGKRSGYAGSITMDITKNAVLKWVKVAFFGRKSAHMYLNFILFLY